MKHTDLICRMTLMEKCLLLSGKNTWQTHDVERLGIPCMNLSDGPSGLRKQAGAGDHLGLNASTRATCIPSASTLANGWSSEITEAMGAVVGADARSQGVQVLLGPGLNTKRSSLCGRSFEYYSEDPYLAGKLAAGYIRGVQKNGVSACAKHFAANSQELLRMHSDSVMDERTLRELYLTNFEIAIKEGRPHCVMTSYNRLNGTYTNENTHLYEILRGEWGYDGMVVTDWGGSNSYVEGVRAGMNLEMPAAGADSAIQLMEAVRKGEISEETVNQRVDELLDIILMTTAVKPEPVDPEKQHEAVRQAAEQCAVLLKNDHGILPLKKETKVALIGDFAAHPRYQGAGSSMVNPQKVDETLAFLSGFFSGQVGYAQGFERLDRENTALEEEAVNLAGQAEAVLLYIGLPESFETEGLDRAHMCLPENQIRLIEKLGQLNVPVIAVLSCGSAVEMPWIDSVDALLYGGLGGEAGAEALLRLLAGEANPGGKLAETFPVLYDETPVSRYYPGKEAASEYREGIYVGYRYFCTAKRPVRFPFGYGLSYTQFEYGNLAVTEQGVSFSVKNTGERDGDEIAQLYVSLPGAKIFRPALELKGFARVSLKAGETQKIVIPFDEYTFRYFNVQSSAWEIEGGTWEILIAASCEDIRLRATWQVRGTGKQNPYAKPVFDCYKACDLMDVSDEAFQALLGRRLSAHTWDRSKPLEENDTIRQLFYAQNPIARLAYKILTRKVTKAIENGKPDLNLLFIYNVPFRGMAKLMNGMVTADMARDILFMCNGHGFRGLGRLIRHMIRKAELKKEA